MKNKENWLWELIHKYKILFFIITKSTGEVQLDVYDRSYAPNQFGEVRRYREFCAWIWLKPFVAIGMLTFLILITISVAQNWPELASRFGAMLVAMEIIDRYSLPKTE
ncbi:MAG: hypothetical protein WBC85_09050, partial [Planktotalea sp.]|uniref:hypothetical protein n=1 Tax=Planktotalea sp. TaxID=2029877 RepID=UPI003C72314C